MRDEETATDAPPEGRRERAARGTIVNAGFNVGLSVLALVRSFAVATFLTVSDYGVWGILVVVLGTLQFLRQVGISDRYVQQDDADQRLAFQKAFTAEAVFSVGFAVVGCVSLPIFALLYGNWSFVAPGFVAMLAVPANILRVPAWVFYRRMDFVRQRTLEAVDAVVAFAVTIALAAAGLGYWGLVAGVLAGAWAAAFVTLRVSPYPLAWHFDARSLRGYLTFSWPLLASGAAGLLVAQSSVLVAQRKLGLEGAGAVALAASVAVYANRVDQVVTTTLYPAICAVKDRVDLLFESFVKSNRLALMWGFPFGIGAALFASDLVHYVIGEKWRPAVPLLAAFGAISAFNHIGFNWDAYYRARAETRPVAVVGGLSLVAFLASAIPLLITDGLDGFAIGMGITALVGLVLRAWYLGRLFPRFRMLRHALRALAPSVPAAALVLVMRETGATPGAAGAVAELVAYVAATAVATWALERPLLREVMRYLRPQRTPRSTAHSEPAHRAA